MVYQVFKLDRPFRIDSAWDEAPWKDVPAVELKNYMGSRPEHFPKTQAKMLYDDEHVYVIFRVEDRYVRAVARGYHSRVWQDSCVEFFFTPSRDISQGYFNVEINAGGTMLFQHQRARNQQVVQVSEADCARVEIFPTLPEIIDPEIPGPVTWMIAYRLPLALLEKYAPVERPGPGVVWRANFYKCGDKTSQPHWLTWSKVDRPQPDFHRPEYFGAIEFK